MENKELYSLAQLKKNLNKMYEEAEDMNPEEYSEEYVKENPDKFKATYSAKEVVNILDKALTYAEETTDYFLDSAEKEQMYNYLMANCGDNLIF